MHRSGTRSDRVRNLLILPGVTEMNRFKRVRHCRHPRGRKHAVELGVERFEDRFLLSTFTVTNTLDNTSSGSLRWAVGQADAATSPSSIAFSVTGIITLSNGQLELSNGANAISIEGPGASLLTISGGGTSRVFQVDSGVTATLSDLTISGGSTTGSGGGLYNSGMATLTDVTMSGNSAGMFGGGLENQGAMTVSNSTFTSDSATHAGGGINNDGSITITASTFDTNYAGTNGGGYSAGGAGTITDCTFSDNQSANAAGGAYAGQSTTTLNLTNCTFSGNSASTNGGGLDNNGVTTLTNCTVSDNSAGDGGGGLANFGMMTVSNCTLTSDSATYAGGGINNGDSITIAGSTFDHDYADTGGGYSAGGSGTITDCTFTDNPAVNGGGVFSGQSTTTLSLTGCTFSGNSASSFGGGVCSGSGLVGDDGGTTTLTNCTLSGNSADRGGGVFNYQTGNTTLTNCTLSGNSATNGGGLDQAGGTITIVNTIVAQNTAATSGPDALGSFASQGNNLIGETDGSTGWVSSDLTGTIASPLNPLLAPLGNYGGPTQTMALLPGSPAIDAGNNALILTDVTTDQRGLPRIVNGTVDIGAFESSGFTIAVTSGSGQSANITEAFANPLVATVTVNNANEPVAGGQVTFTVPASGASATLSVNPVTIAANGTASTTPTANVSPGSYTVTATATGVTTPASFSLANDASLVVNSTSDGNTAPGVTTLRQAITYANTFTSGIPTITFDISSGPFTITPTTALPTITVPVLIDGTSQPGYNGTPIVELNGGGGAFDGLILGPGSNGSTIEGLTIEDFDDGIQVNSANNTIGGTAAGAGNTIADNTGSAVNVFSGSGNSIRQNLIYGNGGTAIVLTGTANNSQPPPSGLAYTSVSNLTTIDYSLTGTVGQTYSLDFFASSSLGSPAAVYLGTTTVTLTTTPQSFMATFNMATALLSTQAVTATVTAPDNSTSPFAVAATVASPFVVTNTTDSGIGSLRQAILDANVAGGRPTITFTLSSPYQITLSSPLPAITTPVVIDGTSLSGFAFGTTMVELSGSSSGGGDGLTLAAGSAGSTIEGLDIVGFQAGAGILVESAGDTIESNEIGVITGGTNGANQVGVQVDNVGQTTIGGTTTGASNAIGFNTTAGVQIVGTSSTDATNTRVEGNLIGTNAAGTASWGNGTAVQIFNASDNTIGGTSSAAANVIGFNTSAGVSMLSGSGNAVNANTYDGTNGSLQTPSVAASDIGVGVGANGNLQPPQVLSASFSSNNGTLTIELSSNVSTATLLDVYLYGASQRTFLGETTIAANGFYGSLSVSGVTTSSQIVATQTVSGDGTSAFSSPISDNPPILVTTTNDNGNNLAPTPGSLRAEILAANATSGASIAFDIPNNDISFGTYIIDVTAPLPPITVPVTIDGTTQPGFDSNNPVPVVEIANDGTAPGSDGLILALGSDGNSIKGLDIVGFGGAGIHIESNDDVIAGNFLGTDPTGKNAGPGNSVGVLVDNASNNMIGGTVPAQGTRSPSIPSPGWKSRPGPATRSSRTRSSATGRATAHPGSY